MKSNPRARGKEQLERFQTQSVSRLDFDQSGGWRYAVIVLLSCDGVVAESRLEYGEKMKSMADTDTVHLAAIVYERGFALDTFLADLCSRLSAKGLRLGGLIQAMTGIRGSRAASITAIDLRNGRRFNIWAGPGARASDCRLDEHNLADAVPMIMSAIEERVDLVIVNRFGRAESHGSGLLTCVSAAVSTRIPVLTAIREPYITAWQEYHGDLAASLDPDLDAVMAWCESAAFAASAINRSLVSPSQARIDLVNRGDA